MQHSKPCIDMATVCCTTSRSGGAPAAAKSTPKTCSDAHPTPHTVRLDLTHTCVMVAHNATYNNAYMA